MMDVESVLLSFAGFGLAPAEVEPRLRLRRPRLGAAQPAAAQVEGVPAQAEAVPYDREQSAQAQHGGGPAQRRKDAKRVPERRAQGKTFRSSSKCGPSRRVGQSPPQTTAVPCRTATALNAAAMRGYSGQSHRTWPSTRAATSTA